MRTLAPPLVCTSGCMNMGRVKSAGLGGRRTTMPKRKPTAPPSGSRHFPVYHELKVGGGSKRALLQALDRDGCYVGNCAREMIARTSFAGAESPRTIKLARVQLHTLGFTEWVAWSDVLKAAAKAGAEKLS